MYLPRPLIGYPATPRGSPPGIFAPPLLAFSPEAPGSSFHELKYNIDSSVTRRPITTPLVRRKMGEIEEIRNTGHALIRPIGIGKTELEIDGEKLQQSPRPSESRQTTENTPDQVAPMVLPDHDLDADVLEVDDGVIDDLAFLSGDENEDNDGFMANEVEYQPDHSLDLVVPGVTGAPGAPGVPSSRQLSRVLVDDPEVLMEMD